MTAKRTRFKRKKGRAPQGREPDEIGAILAAVRENTITEPPPIMCRRCRKHKPATDFAQPERIKLRPMCRQCATTPLPTGGPAFAVEKPRSPISRHAAYRKGLADAELDAQFDHVMKLLEEEERIAQKRPD